MHMGEVSLGGKHKAGGFINGQGLLMGRRASGQTRL